MQKKPTTAHAIERWSKEHDASSFKSNMARINRYIQDQANRDVSSHTSAIFVLVEKGSRIIRGYYSLSSASVIFDDLPTKIQKKLPRYPQTSAILLGRLGVDLAYSEKRTAELGEKARLGELLLVDAQAKALAGTSNVGSALMIIDAEMPEPEELASGTRDPLTFYTQYGFVPLSIMPRRLVKTMRAIAREFEA